MKKTITIIILLLTVSMSAFAQTQFTYNNISYSVLSEEDKTVEVYETANFAGGELIIPEKVYYDNHEYTVTGIGASALFYTSSITSVSIPATVKTIGPSVFQNCTNLTSCTFEGESRLEQIGYNAFRNSGLTTIKIPAAVKTIGEQAFQGCTNLTSCTFEGKSQLEQIGSYTFSSTGLINIKIPAAVKTIGQSAFKDCTNLTSCIFEGQSQLDKISFQAFKNTGLISIDIPASVSSIGAGAFASNTELRQVYMHRDKPNGYDYLAFDECRYVVINAPSVEAYEAYKNWFIHNTVEGPIKDLAPEIEEGLKTLNTLSDEDRETINTSLATIKKPESFSEAYAAYKTAMAIINAQSLLENKLKGVISTFATKQNGSAIRIVGEDGKTFQLYKIKKVDFIKVNE